MHPVLQFPYDVFALAGFFMEAMEYAKVPPIAIADPITVLRSMASLKMIADTTMIITRFAVFKTEEVTLPTCAVKAKANSL